MSVKEAQPSKAIVATLPGVLEQIASILLQARVPPLKARMKAVIEGLMATKLPRPAVLEQIERNARTRDAFIKASGGLMTSLEVAKLAASEAGNRAQLAYRWKKEGKIFSVQFKGEPYYPAFQFEPHTGRPHEVIPRLIKTLGKFYTGWSLALWFTSGSDWLDGKRPIDVIAKNPEAALGAAKAETAAMDE
jgi:hypothetical protein